MAITLNTTATVTTPQSAPLVCDSGWVDNCTIEASARTLEGTTIKGSLIPYASNAATTKVPTFADDSAAIKINVSNLAAALKNYPARFGPALQAISQGFQDLATTEIPANMAKLAKAQADAAPAQKSLMDSLWDESASKEALGATRAACVEIGKIGAKSPEYIAAYQACIDAQADLTKKTQAVADARDALAPFTAVIVKAQAAVDDLSNPPLP